jgi:hypothetical protein
LPDVALRRGSQNPVNAGRMKRELREHRASISSSSISGP